MTQLDDFIEYLFVIEEGSDSLNQDQIQKLELIQTKVEEIVRKVEATAASIQSHPIMEPALAENRVTRFTEYEMLSEKIAKRGKNWVVLDSKGKKVLGTHANRDKAVKQLQAIEISKMKAKGTWKKG
jgi:hypothetical protein